MAATTAIDFRRISESSILLEIRIYRLHFQSWLAIRVHKFQCRINLLKIRPVRSKTSLVAAISVKTIEFCMVAQLSNEGSFCVCVCLEVVNASVIRQS